MTQPYRIYVTPTALKEIKSLPGHIRQRVRRAISELANKPRPAKTKALEFPDLECEVRRLRIDRWRIVYAISEEERVLDVFAVRKRPPYDYGDLSTLLDELGLS